MNNTVAISLKYVVEDGAIKDRYARALYWILMARAKNGRVFITRESLGKTTGFHVDKISRLLSFLKEQSIIKVFYRGPKGMVIYLPRYKWEKLEPGKFITVPVRFLLNSHIKLQARIVATVLRAYSYKGKAYSMDLNRLSKVVGFSPRTISRHLPQITTLGITKILRARHICNVYLSNDAYSFPIRGKSLVYSPPKKFGSRKADKDAEDRAFDALMRKHGAW